MIVIIIFPSLLAFCFPPLKSYLEHVFLCSYTYNYLIKIANGAVKCHTCLVVMYCMSLSAAIYGGLAPVLLILGEHFGLFAVCSFPSSKKGTIYNQMPPLEDIPDEGVNTRQNIAS